MRIAILRSPAWGEVITTVRRCLSSEVNCRSTADPGILTPACDASFAHDWTAVEPPATNSMSSLSAKVNVGLDSFIFGKT